MSANKIALALALASLFGCGSGTSDPASPPQNYASAVPTGSSQQVHFEGVWQGTLTPTGSDQESQAIAMINGWGEFRLTTGDTQFIGFPLRTKSQVSGSLEGIKQAGEEWSDGSRTAEFELSGSIDNNQTINAGYTGSVEIGTMTLAWPSGLDRATLAEIEGTWSLLDDLQNPTASYLIETISGHTSRITGNHSNGCMYAGLLEIWTSYHFYNVERFELTNCPTGTGVNINGEYSGSAAIVNINSDGTDEEVLIIAISNDSNQITFHLHRFGSD